MKIGAVVLAAGGSTRLGQPKQLLAHEGQALVRRTANAAIEAGCDPIVVVVGAEREKVATALRDLTATIVPNDNWPRGVGTSIRAGVARLQESDAVILLVCDQPKVEADLLRQLVARQQETGQPMIASSYAGTLGVPALFTRACYGRLLALDDETGAKALLLARPAEVASVPFEAGALDIDTPEDLEFWRG
ncbi:nucleotidyltransferase family protein [soil metagenome]